VRVVPLVIVAALTGTPARAQPPELPDGMIDYEKRIAGIGLRHYYTAFPGIMTPGYWRGELRYDKAQPPLPAIASDAAASQKLRYLQAREGLDCLDQIREIIQTGSWTSQFYLQHILMSGDAYRVAAEVEEATARHVPWYEARVRKFKELERFAVIRTFNGSDPPHRIDMIRFARFQAEAELLGLKAEVKRAGRPPAGRPEAPQHDALAELNRPGYTAFPDLKPGAIETKTVKESDGKTHSFHFIRSAARPPGLPVLPPNANPLRRVRHRLVTEGLESLHRITELIRAGEWTSQYFDETIQTAAGTFRWGADLETDPADRVPWHEARVRVLKEFESFTEARVKNGNDPRIRLSVVRFHRLQAEADLLVLLTEAKKADHKPGPPVERVAFDPKAVRSDFTAFPELKPPFPKIELIGNPVLGPVLLRVVEHDIVPLPPLPLLAPDAPPLRRVRYEQLRAGLGFLDKMRQTIRVGSWISQFLLEHLEIASGVYPVGASLEATQENRVKWYEARVGRLKGIEQFIKGRVEDGRDRPHRLNLVRIYRLRAEAELLALTAGVSAAPAAPVPLCFGPRTSVPPPAISAAF
jgi:hypothetical protein